MYTIYPLNALLMCLFVSPFCFSSLRFPVIVARRRRRCRLVHNSSPVVSLRVRPARSRLHSCTAPHHIYPGIDADRYAGLTRTRSIHTRSTLAHNTTPIQTRAHIFAKRTTTFRRRRLRRGRCRHRHNS